MVGSGTAGHLLDLVLWLARVEITWLGANAHRGDEESKNGRGEHNAWPLEILKDSVRQGKIAGVWRIGRNIIARTLCTRV